MLSGPEWLNELGTGLNFATSLVAMALKDVILRPSLCHRGAKLATEFKNVNFRKCGSSAFSFSV
jgi:hypothetical protein